MTKVDQNGTMHTYSFDLLGRMTADAVTLASGNPQNVDSSVLRIETSYNTQGLSGTITSFDATSGGNITNQVQNVYNGLGQLTSQFQEHAGAVNTSTSLHVDYGYSDLAHGARLASLTYPNGRVLTYNYGTSASVDDSISRLTSIADGNTTLESYAYLGQGTLVERNHPESGANLTYIKLTGESDGDAGDQYTGLDRFTRVVDQRWIDGSGTALDRYGYSYDRNSNRLTKSNSLNGNLSESYSYDDLNRLANMTRGGSAYQSWDLDGLGNMNSVTTGNVTESRTHNDQNQLTSMGNATLAFDNNGNTITDDQGHTLVYDAWNRLIAVKNGATLLKTFTYDGQGWRIREAPAGGNATQLYYSDQWQVLEERQNGNATAQNVWGITYVDQLVLRDRDADQDASHTLEERLYALQDANENVTAIVTTSGSVAERYVLDPYGVASVRNSDWSVRGDGTVSASTFGWVYLHQGGRFDLTANLYSFRHRDYSPAMMRWAQQDPMGYVDGLTLYGYTRNNPVVRNDPLGLQTPSPTVPADPTTRPPARPSTVPSTLPGPGDPFYDLGVESLQLRIAYEGLKERDPIGANAIFFFIETQQAIVTKLAMKKCPCAGKREEEWLRDVVRDFMRPLVQSLRERGTAKGISDPGWKTFFDEYDKGTWNRQTRLKIRVPEHLAAANAMARNHIENDLRRSLRLHGFGTDPTWKCIGKLVDDTFRAQLLNPGNGIIIDQLQKIWDDMNVSKIRDKMRDQVIRDIGTFNEFIP